LARKKWITGSAASSVVVGEGDGVPVGAPASFVGVGEGASVPVASEDGNGVAAAVGEAVGEGVLVAVGLGWDASGVIVGDGGAVGDGRAVGDAGISGDGVASGSEVRFVHRVVPSVQATHSKQMNKRYHRFVYMIGNIQYKATTQKHRQAEGKASHLAHYECTPVSGLLQMRQDDRSAGMGVPAAVLGRALS
jgi:hypothetical protein